VIRDLGNGWLAEVAELRQVKVPKPDAPPPEVYAALLTVRGNLDRVEAILSQAMTVRSGAELSARELADRAGDKLDERIKARAARARDYESARERLAEASLDALQERQAARSAQKIADMAASVEARVRLAHRGLDSLRSDLQTALRYLPWESSLDR
jgi:hypothetical protein